MNARNLCIFNSDGVFGNDTPASPVRLRYRLELLRYEQE